MGEKNKVTKQHLEELKAELDYLEKVERPRNLEELKDARAQGDLSENADYHAAKDQQGVIENRIREIRYILDNHEIIVAKFYTLKYVDKDYTDTFEIVGTQESNPLEKKISNESPIGKAIDGTNIGDRVTVHANGKDFDVIIMDIK